MRKPKGKQVEIEELRREQPEELTPEAAEEAQGGLGDSPVRGRYSGKEGGFGGWPARSRGRYSAGKDCDLNHRLAAFGSIVWPRAACQCFGSHPFKLPEIETGTIMWPKVQKTEVSFGQKSSSPTKANLGTSQISRKCVYPAKWYWIPD